MILTDRPGNRAFGELEMINIAPMEAYVLDSEGGIEATVTQYADLIAVLQNRVGNGCIYTVVFDRFGSVPGPDWSDELTERSAALIIENLKRHMEV